MKKKLFFVMLACLVVLTGCKTEKEQPTKSPSSTTQTENKSAYNSAMEKGNEAIVNKEFDKAEASFELALEYDSKSEKAKNYLKQVSIYKEALKNFNNKIYSQAFDLANNLKEISGSKNLARYADELLKQIEQALEEEKKIKTEVITTPIVVRTYSEAEKQAITQEFLNWAIPRAQIGNMTVTSQYFAHGAGGRGDWYGVTVDGRIQVQELMTPGYNAFELHSLGGVVFYTSLDGSTGLNENFESIASGYSTKANPEKKITKYLLADTGNIYEYGATGRSMIAFSSGFTEASDDGQFSDDSYLPVFQQSGDVDAINKLKEIVRKYQ